MRYFFFKRVLKNVIKGAFDELNNNSQDKLNKISPQQSANVRFFLSHNYVHRIELKEIRVQNMSLSHVLEVFVLEYIKYVQCFEFRKSYLTRV